jgi:DNA-binding CsgD family transcriptional regulator/PAS domain-containing protein
MKDQKAIADLIGTIYLCGAGNAEWQEFLDQFGRLFPALKLSLTGYDRSFSGVEILCTSNFDPSFIETYGTHYYKINPWKDLILISPPAPRVAWGHHAVPVPELQKTEFYADWIRPQDDVATGFTTLLFNEQDRFMNLAVNVNPKHLKEAEAAAESLTLIGPHLRRAFELYRQVMGARLEGDGFASVLNLLTKAVFIVDATGKIRFANAKAERLLREETILRSAAGSLRFLDPGDQRAVMEAIRRAATDLGGRPIIPLRADAGGRCFAFVSTLSSQPAGYGSLLRGGAAPIALFVVDARDVPRARADHIAAMLHVTPAEARLALALLHDKSLKEFAGEAGISFHTARRQMRSLLEKTGTHRQAQLVRLLASTLAGVNWFETG